MRAWADDSDSECYNDFFKLERISVHKLEQLEAGQLAGLTHLKLSQNLTSFPMSILSLADTLEILDLTGNQLASLPKEIGQLKQLKIIFASNNCFEELPEVLGLCPELEMVGFKSNRIKRVSAQSLPAKLRWLILTDNQLQILPDALGERPRLQKLALAGNQLVELPHTMSQCENLELVRISANQLSECPAQLLDLPKLAWLAFSGNPFVATSEKPASIPEVSSSSFSLQEVLGQGASGVISKAVWRQPQSQFPEHIAVKVFKGDVTSDGYPIDELQARLKVGDHPNLVHSLAQVSEENCLALVMNLIPPNYTNLGMPPNFQTCTRDTFPADFNLPIATIEKIIAQMNDVFECLHAHKVNHGDLYAHNTLFDSTGNIIFGDFGAASMYHMLKPEQQLKIKAIEQRALNYMVEDLLSVCCREDQNSEAFTRLKLSAFG